MINLCLVVIATQFSETKKREMERMLLERKRFHSSSTLASNSEPGGCYDEILKYIAHLFRKGRRRFNRWLRRRMRSIKPLASSSRRMKKRKKKKRRKKKKKKKRKFRESAGEKEFLTKMDSDKSFTLKPRHLRTLRKQNSKYSRVSGVEVMESTDSDLGETKDLSKGTDNHSRLDDLNDDLDDRSKERSK